jgi:hypothetical protein
MMFIIHSEDYRDVKPPQGLMDAMEKFVGEGFKSGALIDTAGLQPTAKATRIRSKGGKLKVTDGPFSEAKEVVGGYAIVEAKTREDAMALATEFMELHRIHWPEFECVGEVRPMENFEAPAK